MPRFVRIFGIVFIEGMFWFTVVFGLSGMAWFGLGIEPSMYWRQYWGLIIASSAFGGGVLASMVSVTDFVFCRALFEAYGVTDPPLRVEVTIDLFTDVDDAMELVKKKLLEIGARNIEMDLDEGTIRARKGFSFVTSGEILSVRVEDMGEGAAKVHLGSQPRGRTSFIDFGMNARNIARLARLIEKKKDCEE